VRNLCGFARTLRAGVAAAALALLGFGLISFRPLPIEFWFVGMVVLYLGSTSAAASCPVKWVLGGRTDTCDIRGHKNHPTTD